MFTLSASGALLRNQRTAGFFELGLHVRKERPPGHTDLRVATDIGLALGATTDQRELDLTGHVGFTVVHVGVRLHLVGVFQEGPERLGLGGELTASLPLFGARPRGDLQAFARADLFPATNVPPRIVVGVRFLLGVVELPD